MPGPSSPRPDEPKPQGVTPNKPDDPDVYGTQWGNVGGQKPKDEPSDRPKPISTPDKQKGATPPNPPSPPQEP